jgi:hypothetical protein
MYQTSMYKMDMFNHVSLKKKKTKIAFMKKCRTNIITSTYIEPDVTFIFKPLNTLFAP